MKVPFILYLKFCFLLLLFVTLAPNSFAQQASLDGTKLIYRNFKTNSINANTRGFGYTYRNAKFIKGKDRLFEIEFANVRDAKEKKIQGQGQGQGFKTYYFGKLNSAYSLRLGLGWQKALYNKEVPTAIEIKNGFTFGATLGLLKPIYVQVYSQTTRLDSKTVVAEQYDPSIHTQNRVLGRASFFNGISRTTISPGAFLKYYYIFDFAPDDDRIKALECGVIADYYLNGLEIMANNTPKKFMLTLYVAYTFGDKKF